MNSISLVSLLKLAIKNIYIIVIATLIAAFAAIGYCKFIAKPLYSARGSVVVTNGGVITETEIDSSDRVNNSDIVASLKLKTTIIDILRTSEIYKNLAEKFDNQYSYGQLMRMCSVESRNEETLFIDITFTASTPQEAINLENEFLALVPDYILEYVPNSHSAVTTTADYASKTHPRTFRTTFLAALFGAALSFGAVYVFTFFNNTVDTEDDIKDNYDIPLIGNIPDFHDASGKNYYKNAYYSSKGGY